MLYLWVKAFHLVFVVAWMAGLVMYPRLKIYQLNDSQGGKLFEMMSEASIRLRKIIMTPSLIAVWALGLLMVALNPSIATGGWFITKLVLVLVITGFHGWFTALGKKIDAGTHSMSEKQLRMLNEVPFVAMIGVVILVIVKPF